MSSTLPKMDSSESHKSGSPQVHGANFGVDHAEVQQHTRELSILNSIAQALNRETDLDEALDTVLAQVADLFGLRTGWIFLINEETNTSYLAAARNLPPALASKPERMTGGCHCLDTYYDGDLDGAANVNIITCTRLSQLVTGTDGLRFHASIPLYGQATDGGEEPKLGVLNVASADWAELSDEDLRLLYTVGDMLSIAIERAHLFGRSAQLGAVEERNRLAREIHDTLAQGLSAIALQLETVDALLEPVDASSLTLEKARGYVQQALKLARSSLHEARRSVMDLRAAPLEGRTLGQALSTLAEKHPAAKELPVKFTLRGDDRPLPVHIEAGLYRIAQEGLTNIARHADAHHASLLLTLLPETVTLLIEDDGKGFDVDEIAGGDNGDSRFGLVGLYERAKLLGGEVELESGRGVGTKVTVTVPLG